MKRRQCLSIVALGLGLAMAVGVYMLSSAFVARADPTVYYVREGEDGDCSLVDPCGSVQKAIDLAAAGGSDNQVWVATGVYTNLVIDFDVVVMGGWDGTFTVRDPDTTPTVLDGGGDHIVRIGYGSPDWVTPRVSLVGLTMRNGQDGIHIDTGEVSVESCAIVDVNKQGFEVDGGQVTITATQITTAQQGIEVDEGTVRATGVTIARTTQEGLLMEGPGALTVTHSLIRDCDQEGVQIDLGHLWLFDTTVQDVLSDGVRIADLASAGIISNVIRNVLTNPGADYHGIQIEGNQLVQGNWIENVDDRGICARGGAPTIRFNTVLSAGGDGIRAAATCTDVEIRGNAVVTAGNDGIDVRGTRVTVASNRVVGSVDNGIKVDLVTGWAQVDGNWTLENGVGIAIREAAVFTLSNNVMGDNLTAGLELTGTATGAVVHNTLVGSSTGVHGTGLVVQSPSTATVVNNIVASHTVGITATAGASLVVSNTLLWGNGSDPISGSGVITGPPLFLAPVVQDYHIISGSHAIDAGVDVGLRTDVDHDARSVPPDVGADEIARRVYLPIVMRGYPLQ